MQVSIEFNDTDAMLNSAARGAGVLCGDHRLHIDRQRPQYNHL